MKKKKLVCGVLVGLSLVFGSIGFEANTIVARAEPNTSISIGDEIQKESRAGVSGVTARDDSGVAEFFKNHRSMTSEQLNKASDTVSPLTNIFGYLMGGLIAITSSAIFLITALDLLYIGVPVLRGVLYKSGSQGGGYGQQGGSKGFQLVSDEAVQASASAVGGGSPQGGMGGYGMQGGMQQQQGSKKSVITSYLKKRVVFLVLFAVCTVILTSSILLGTGVNLAQWVMRLIEILNDAIPSLSIPT